MDCRECGARLDADASFCTACGTGVDRQAGTTRVDPMRDTDPFLTRASDGGQGQRACPRCGAPNPHQRLLCGRCGADLQTGDPGRQPTARFDGRPRASDPEDQPAERSHERRILLAVIGVAVVAGGIIGAVLLTGGLGGPDLPQPPPLQDPRQLLVARRAVASSTADGAASAGLIADGDVTTAWRAAPGEGAGTVLGLMLDQPAWIQELQFAVGDQRSERSFQALSRPTRVRVHFGDDRPVVVELADQPGVQRVRLDRARRTRELRIEILATAPGAEQDTAALSEVALRGQPAGATAGAATPRRRS